MWTCANKIRLPKKTKKQLTSIVNNEQLFRDKFIRTEHDMRNILYDYFDKSLSYDSNLDIHLYDDVPIDEYVVTETDCGIWSGVIALYIKLYEIEYRIKKH